MQPLLASIRRGIAPIVGPRHQRLSLLYVDDLAAAVVSWLTHWKACTGGVFSIDDGREGGYDWPAIIDEVKASGAVSLRFPEPVLRVVAGVNMFSARIFGYKPMLTLGKVQELRQAQWLCDNAPFTEATGWTPTVRLRQGVDRLLGAA
jgi:nucleoside-diphosphate-sugar epimerase